MDAVDLDPATYRNVLSDLARVNWWTFARVPTLQFLERVVPKGGSFSLLDVGFGHGDMLRTIAKWAQRTGREARLVGVDLNPNSRDVAVAATPSELAIDYVTGDYRDLGGFDVICSSLVAHHMDDGQLRTFLRHMDREGRMGWIVNDLYRHGFAHAAFPWLARLLGVHRIVREDGRLSIARAFRPEDWRAILADAELERPTTIRRHFPFRLCVTCER